ncbi:hypothetical protein OK351_02095 [Glutamicibacter sp. MNS18]|uniref:GNAT family N-acetyltransferase n=1 Tax=Glutamicibacter sp. MNS18 TaxID=2989817 RepID=UPI002235EE38|nr:GNAT family N-acetyltransferase [Glutamicibacter sp. MNS18]MCW4464302.1 hypothetical protein [Glutamicibacter sp. MNS18]
MNPVTVIRPCTGTGEICALLELWRSSKDNERELLSVTDIDWLAHLVEVVFGDSARVLVADRAAVTEGFMVLEAGRVLLLWVRPEARGMGAGTRLLGWALCKYPDLLVEVKRHNLRGIEFCRVQGFVPVAPGTPWRHADGQRLLLGLRDDRMGP